MHTLFHYGWWIMRYLITAFKTNFRLSITLKISFIITIFIVIAKQPLFLIAWKSFFGKYHIVQGWDFKDMALMYGIVSFGIGFVEVFFYGLRELPRLIETHQLDVYLLQPKNLILNIALSKGDITALGEIILGILLMSYSGYLLSFTIILIAFLAIVFIFSLYLYLSSMRFFVQNGTNFVRELYQNANIVATQPNSAYRGLFKIFTMTLLPTAFMSFYPVEFLRTGLLENLYFATLGTFLFFLGAQLLFKLGLRRYESGNDIALRN